MDNLEKLFKNNHNELNTWEDKMVLEHETRFQTKLFKFKRIQFIKIAAMPIAASFILLVSLTFFLKNNTQNIDALQGISSDYYSEVDVLQKSYCENLDCKTKKEIENTIRRISFEAIPLIEQLPQELPQKQKAIILKGYYTKKLNAVKRLKSCLPVNITNI